MSRRGTTKEFVAKAITKHGTKYSYKKTCYVSASAKVIITCGKHGDFEQTPANHLTGYGCNACGYDASGDKRRQGRDDFIAKAIAVHGDRYDYSEVVYTNIMASVAIICPEHGRFLQAALNHLAGHKCNKCKYAADSINRRMTHKEFVKRANIKHDSFYSYPMQYKGITDLLDIECPTHGIFQQQSGNHLAGARCPSCSIKLSKVESRVAKFVARFAKVECGSFKIIAPMQLDIYVPEKKLGIEINGAYWHSDLYKSPKYHYEKAKLCAEKRIRLLQFWESDVKNKSKIVASVILNALGKSKTIYARNTEVREVCAVDARAFQNATHMQGFANASIYYGLYYEDILVCCMSFGKARFTKLYEWELVRFSSALRTVVVGGASKLFTHFLRANDAKSIVSYADLMISKGDLYRTLGFTRSHTSAPNYTWQKGNVIIPRYRSQKHKLAALLGTAFNAAMSEDNNMRAAGFIKVHDAGNLVFTYGETNVSTQ
jgi:ssDNA-binding Zn-finger/Zn-ribbon topoisomerase 1